MYFISDFSVELLKTLRNDVQSLDFIYEYANLERLMINSFNSSKKFREGNLKTSFIYLLIDPRISENLLAELSVFFRSKYYLQIHSAVKINFPYFITVY